MKREAANRKSEMLSIRDTKLKIHRSSGVLRIGLKAFYFHTHEITLCYNPVQSLIFGMINWSQQRDALFRENLSVGRQRL